MKYYTNSHEWVEKESEESATVGISARAQKELGDVVYLELPKIGTIIQKGEAVAVVESTKAAADLYAPLSGEVLEVNETLLETPSLLNGSSETWLYKLCPSDLKELSTLLTEESYAGLFGNASN